MVNLKGLGDATRIGVCSPFSISGSQYSIRCSPEDSDSLSKEILETVPVKPVYICLDFLISGIERPTTEEGYLDRRKLDKYLNDCLGARVAPFTTAVFSDQIYVDRRVAGDSSGLEELGYEQKQSIRIVSSLVPRGVGVFDDIQNEINGKGKTSGKYVNGKFERVLQEEDEKKIKEALREAMALGYRSHILSFHTRNGKTLDNPRDTSKDADGYSLFMSIWEKIKEEGRVERGFIGLAERDRLDGANRTVTVDSLGLVFGTEETPSLCTDGSRDEKIDPDTTNKTNIWWDGLVKKYHKSSN